MKGDFDQALMYYKQAQMYASTVDDTASQIRYDENVIRLVKVIHPEEENATLVQDVLTVAPVKKKEQDAEQSPSQQGWMAWLQGGNKK
jgi:hypothetical protein